ncbi:MAG: alpha-hydroxy acid oxidase, partial [Paracoccaceae bacterium]
RALARRRLPHFAWEYLDSSTGTEQGRGRNRARLDAVEFLPSILHGAMHYDHSTTLFGQTYARPFGISPVGMSGLYWPNAEITLAQCAAKAGIPYGMSTVATLRPEDLTPHMGQYGWFQLYPPARLDILRDMLARIKAAGFKVLVLTVDVPVASRRERQLRSGLTSPPVITPRLFFQIAARPAWALAMARTGMPTMAFIDDYADPARGLSSVEHAGYMLRTSPGWDYLETLRAEWDGPLVVKGVMRTHDIPRLEAAGVDGIWVSNHGARQLEGAPATIDVLPGIRDATQLPVLFDSGIEGGLDILRAIALGADMVMLGRGFHYAVSALGARGVDHLIEILTLDMEANMGQLGAHYPTMLRGQARTNGIDGPHLGPSAPQQST